MSKIITLTLNPCIDKTIWIDRLMPEKKLRASNTEDEPGGGGINVSRAIHYLEQNSKAIFCSGGCNGAYFQQLLTNESIDFTNVPLENNTRENLLIIDQSTSLEYRVGMPSPNISQHEIQNILHIISQQTNYEYFVASGSLPTSIPVNFYAQVAQLVQAHNAKLIIDTSGKALQEVLKEKIFLLKPNFDELCTLCNIEPQATIQQIVTATQQLLQQINCQIIVVSLSANGAILVTATQHFYTKPPFVQVKSTVGAGDSMVAGLTLALSKNLPLQQVLQYGVACGTAATLNSGKGLCNKTDVDRLLHQLINE